MTDRCPLGQYNFCLQTRWDVQTLVSATKLLVSKGFEYSLALTLAGFLHIYYWAYSVAFALSLILSHPSIFPTRGEDVDWNAWSTALEWVADRVEEYFSPLRIVLGVLVARPLELNTGCVLAIRNPCSRARSRADAMLLIMDIRNRHWYNACVQLRERLE